LTLLLFLASPLKLKLIYHHRCRSKSGIFTPLYAKAAPTLGHSGQYHLSNISTKLRQMRFTKKATAKYEMRRGDVPLQALPRGFTTSW